MHNMGMNMSALRIVLAWQYRCKLHVVLWKVCGFDMVSVRVKWIDSGWLEVAPLSPVFLMVQVHFPANEGEWERDCYFI